jgi:hypothetical protein
MNSGLPTRSRWPKRFAPFSFDEKESVGKILSREAPTPLALPFWHWRARRMAATKIIFGWTTRATHD